MPTVQLAPLVKFRVPLDTGAGATGWKLYTHYAGTSNLAPSYTDATGASLNTNPIYLDSRGECDLWLDTAIAYKLTVTDPDDAVLWTKDNITVSTGGGGTGGQTYINASDTVAVSGSGTSLDPFVLEAIVDSTQGNLLQSSQYGLYAQDYDGRVKVSDIDAHNYLEQKILPGAGITITKLANPVGQYLRIDAVAAAIGSDDVANESTVTGTTVSDALETLASDISNVPDRFVCVSANDTAPSCLSNKLSAGTGIALTIENPGGDEQYRIDCTTDLSGYVPYTGATADLDMGFTHKVTAQLFVAGNPTQFADYAQYSAGVLYLNRSNGVVNTDLMIVPQNSDGSINFYQGGTAQGGPYRFDRNLVVPNAGWLGTGTADGTLYLTNGNDPGAESTAMFSDTQIYLRQIGTTTGYLVMDGTQSYLTQGDGQVRVGDNFCYMSATGGSASTVVGMAIPDGNLELLRNNKGFSIDAHGTKPIGLASGIDTTKVLSLDANGALQYGTVTTGTTSVIPIDYSLAGVVAVAQGTKYNPSFSSTNGWYLPTGRTATLKAIGFKSRSLTSTVVGQTLKVMLKSYDPNNAAQRAYGDGTLIGAERTVYTSDFTGTKWDGSGQVSGLSDSLTAGKVYYLDISQISISCDDLVLTLYLELN